MPAGLIAWDADWVRPSGLRVPRGGSTVPVVAVSATSYQPPHSPDLAIDGDPSTRWSYDGDPAHLTLDLGALTPVGGVRIHQWQGDNGNFAVFDVLTSGDGETWETRLLGQSSGQIDDWETFRWPPSAARWVRYVGAGRIGSAWNSVARIEVLRPAGGPWLPQTPVLVLTPADGQIAAAWSPLRPTPAVTGWTLSAGASPETLTEVTSGTSTSFVDEPLANGVPRSYRVAAQGAAGVRLSAVQTATPGVAPSSGWDGAWDAAIAAQDSGPLRAWFQAHTGVEAYYDPALGRKLTLSDLTASGPVTTTHDGQVIEKLNIVAGWGPALTISHQNVTVRACRIRVGGGSAARIHQTPNPVNLTLDHVTIDGDDSEDVAATLWSTHLKHCQISGHRVGLHPGGDVHMEHCYFHGMYEFHQSHNNSWSLQGGQVNVLCEKSFMEGFSSAAVSFYARLGPITDVTFRDNVLVRASAAGYYNMLGPLTNHAWAAHCTRFTVQNNLWQGAGVAGGHNLTAPPNVWSGNVRIEDGSPV